MTCLLAELLNAPEPAFSLRLRQLERASGDPAVDIRLSSALLRAGQQKICELGLDPADTTADELYEALRQRLLADEERLESSIGLSAESSSQDKLSAVLQLMAKLSTPKSCFAIRNSVAKRLLKQQPPRRTMHELGYRSLDSMLKHEPPAQVYVAALLLEPASWHDSFRSMYDSLQPGDFENRSIRLLFPQSQRWQKVTDQLTSRRRQLCLVAKEYGTLVVLPITAELPALTITASLLVLDGVNAVRCASTYLKLQQVGPSFGEAIRRVAVGDPATRASFAGQALPWRLVQTFFHTVKEAYHPALFEPHVQPEDLELAEAEQALAAEVPALGFWEGTAGIAYQSNGQVVSMNMLDVAISTVNRLDYSQRLLHHVREHLWGDIMLGYLAHRYEDVLEQLSSPVAAYALEPAI